MKGELILVLFPAIQLILTKNNPTVSLVRKSAEIELPNL